MNANTRTRLLAFLAAGLFGAWVRADAPATQPIDSKQKIPALIADLAADDFKVRDAASQELRKLGRQALPALTEALRSDDPSIKSYAEGLVAAINEDLSPPKRRTGDNDRIINELRGLRPPGLVRGGAVLRLNNARHTAVNVRVVNGVKDVTVTEDGRKITIHEEPAGDIHMTVTESKDGREQTAEYKAASSDELKTKHPEAHQLYEQYAGADAGGAVRIIERGVRMNLRPPLLPPPDIQRLRDEHRARMDEALRRARVPELERLRIFEDLQDADALQRQLLDEVRRELDRVRLEMRREIPQLHRLLPGPADEDFEELEAPDDD
jgi:hypothetical protein